MGLVCEWGPIAYDSANNPDAGNINRTLGWVLLSHLERDPKFVTVGTPAVQPGMQQVAGDSSIRLTHLLQITSSGTQGSEGTWGEVRGATLYAQADIPTLLPMLVVCNQLQSNAVRANLRQAGWREDDAVFSTKLPKEYRDDVPGQPWIGSPALMLLYNHVISRLVLQARSRRNPVQLHHLAA